MSATQTRREFLKTMTAGVVVMAGAPYIVAAPVPTTKLRMAVIGCGGQGTNAHVPTAAREQLVALVDPDDKNQAAEALLAAAAVPVDSESRVALSTWALDRFDYEKLADEWVELLKD